MILIRIVVKKIVTIIVTKLYIYIYIYSYTYIYTYIYIYTYVNFHESVLSAAHACEGCLGGVGCIRFQKYVILGFRMAHFRLLMY